jgi:hypothetical protein
MDLTTQLSVFRPSRRRRDYSDRPPPRKIAERRRRIWNEDSAEVLKSRLPLAPLMKWTLLLSRSTGEVRITIPGKRSATQRVSVIRRSPVSRGDAGPP